MHHRRPKKVRGFLPEIPIIPIRREMEEIVNLRRLAAEIPPRQPRPRPEDKPRIDIDRVRARAHCDQQELSTKMQQVKLERFTYLRRLAEERKQQEAKLRSRKDRRAADLAVKTSLISAERRRARCDERRRGAEEEFERRRVDVKKTLFHACKAALNEAEAALDYEQKRVEDARQAFKEAMKEKREIRMLFLPREERSEAMKAKLEKLIKEQKRKKIRQRDESTDLLQRERLTAELMQDQDWWFTYTERAYWNFEMEEQTLRDAEVRYIKRLGCISERQRKKWAAAQRKAREELCAIDEEENSHRAELTYEIQMLDDEINELKGMLTGRQT